MTGDLFRTRSDIRCPQSDDERLAWLRLIRSRRVGITTFFRLLHEHGTAARALEALTEIARAAGVRNYAACAPDAARA